MRKKIFILLLSMSLGMIGCSSDDHYNDAHRNTIVGIAIEIKSDHLVLLEISKERGGFQEGDKILVKYEEAAVHDAAPDADVTVNIAPNYKVQLQDELYTYADHVKKLDGYDYTEVESVDKYVDTSDESTNMTK